MTLYAPNVLVAFVGAVGILILTFVLQIKPQHQLIQGARPRASFLKRLQHKLDEADIGKQHLILAYSKILHLTA